MAKPWSEVEKSPKYKSLAPEDQMAAKREYFSTVVTAKKEFQSLGEAEREAARSEFLGASPITKVATPEMLSVESTPASALNSFLKANTQFTNAVRKPLIGSNGGVPRSFVEKYTTGVAGTIDRSPLRNNPNLGAMAYGAVAPVAGIAGMAADAITNPLEAAGNIVGGRLLQSAVPMVDDAAVGFKNFLANRWNNNTRSALSSSKEIPKIKRAGDVFSRRGADIQGRANAAIESEAQMSKSAVAGEFDKLKAETEGLKAQINNTTNITKEAKAAELAKTELSYASKLLDNQEKINGIQKALPKAAQRDAASIKKEIPEWMSKQSRKWNDDIDRLLGGDDADVFVNSESLTQQLSTLLRSRGIDIEDGVAKSLNGQLSVSEKSIADLISRIENSPKSVSVRQLIKDTNAVGSKIKYGKVYNSEQSLLDDAKDIIAGQAEDIIPGIKDTKAWYSEYAQVRNRAFKSLDPFGGKYSTRGTDFFKKLADGSAKPEDFQFLDDLERSVGKQAGRESFGLSKEQQYLEQFQEKLKQSKAGEIENIQKSLDVEIARLEDVLKKETVGLENKTNETVRKIGEKSEVIINGIRTKAASQADKFIGPKGLANEARIKLARLNRMKAIAKWSLITGAGASGLVGGYEAVTK